MILSSGDGYVGEPFELHQGFQKPDRGSRGKVGFLSRCRSGKGPHLVLKGEFLVFLELWQELWFPLKLRQGPLEMAPVASGKSCLRASYEGPLWIPLQSVPGPRSPSEAEAATSGFLFNADMDLGVPMEFPQGSQARSPMETCKSAFLTSCNSRVRIPVEFT